MFTHNTIPHVSSRLNPSFPSTSTSPSPFPAGTEMPFHPQAGLPFPSPPAVVGGGRFGKRKLSVAQGRGTTSMPTSPLRPSVNEEIREGPHSASTLLTQPDQSHTHTQVQTHSQSPFNTTQIPTLPSFFSDRAISPPDRLEGEYDEYDQHLPEDRGEGEGDDVPPPRKKRAQVRVACTHCQKACKKCSNTRPCERCVKYGLPDCIDSMRKPRKTGVKRGPYKRRTSSLYQHQSEQYQIQPPTQLQPHYSGAYQTYPNPQSQRPHDPSTQAHTIQAAFAAAFDRPRWINGRRQSIVEPPPQTQASSSQYGYGYGYAAPPPPLAVAIGFQNTFLPTLSTFPPVQGQGLRQVRQRIPSISTAHIDRLPTSIKGEERRGSMSSIFPIGLNTLAGQDPFSRTVSPIGHRVPLPVSGLSNAITMDVDMDGTQEGQGEGVDGDYTMTMSTATPKQISIVDFAYNNPNPESNPSEAQVYHSAPTSPRGTRMELDPEPGIGIGRASSAEPPSTITFPLNTDTFHLIAVQNQATGTESDMGMSTMRPMPMTVLGNGDRKPSLFTLMNSRPNNSSAPVHLGHAHHQDQVHLQPHVHLQRRQAQVQNETERGKGTESPTLFDGTPISLPSHDQHRDQEQFNQDRRMSVFGSLSMGMGMGMSLPTAGGVGRLSLSKGSEGLGLGLGLEHVT